MFHQKWLEVKGRLKELQRKHYEEPAGAEFCYGQKLDPTKDRETSFHCYDPSCPNSKRHHQERVEQGSREQLVVSELTESFGLPLLHPLHEPWHERDAPVFERLFEETASLLAMFLREEVEGKVVAKPWYLQGVEDHGADFWCPLQPQIKDTMKVLWHGDLSAEGIYHNIAQHIRKLCSRLLMHALGRAINNPIDYDKAKKKKSPFQKAMCLQKDITQNDPKAKPFIDTCILIDNLGAALVHHRDAADFQLASNRGNTTIMLCRLIVMACAKYMDWAGWSKGPDHPDLGKWKASFPDYLLDLKMDIIADSELCFMCFKRPATHAYLHKHGQRAFAHLIACRQCTQRENMQRCPVCTVEPEMLVEVLRRGTPDEDEQDEQMGSGEPQPSIEPCRGPSLTIPTPPKTTESPASKSQDELKKRAAGKTHIHPDPEQQRGSEEGDTSGLKGKMQGLKLQGDDNLKASIMHGAKQQPLHQADTPMSLGEEAAHHELEALRLWDRGQQHEAEELLKRAASCPDLPHSLQAHLLLKQLELSLQQGALHLSPARKFDCELSLKQLCERLAPASKLPGGTPHQAPSACMSTNPAASSASITTSSDEASLLRRLHMCRGKLCVLLGKHGEAAQCFSLAVEAAGQGGGDLLRCLGEASTAHLTHATQLQHLGLLDPALQAATRSIECAHQASNTATTFHASSLAARMYDNKAAASSTPAWRVPALQLCAFALEQCSSALPSTVGVAEVEGMAHKCEALLHQVAQMHAGAAQPQLPEAFIAKVQEILRDVSLVVASAKSDQHLMALDASFEQLQHSAADLQRRLSVLAQQEQLAGGTASTASTRSTAVGVTTAAAGQQQQQQQQQQQPAQPRGFVANHLNSNKEELIRYWKEFDLEAFQRKGLPALADETEADRKLRVAFTRDVYRYFEETGKLALEAKGLTGVAPAFGPKMHAFAQTVAFRLYRATRNKRRKAAQEEQERQQMMARDPAQAHLSQVATGLQQLQSSSVGMLHSFSALAQKATPTSLPHPTTSPPQKSGFVANHLNSNREELMRYWKEFDLEAFQRKGLPIPPDETEADRKLRAAFTRDVYRYFEETGKLVLESKGQTGVAPAFGPKMHAFAQTVAFRLYRASRNKKRKAAQAPEEAVKQQAPSGVMH